MHTCYITCLDKAPAHPACCTAQCLRLPARMFRLAWHFTGLQACRTALRSCSKFGQLATQVSAALSSCCVHCRVDIRHAVANLAWQQQSSRLTGCRRTTQACTAAAAARFISAGIACALCKAQLGSHNEIMCRTMLSSSASIDTCSSTTYRCAGCSLLPSYGA
jgi:hypothetical protein